MGLEEDNNDITGILHGVVGIQCAYDCFNIGFDTFTTQILVIQKQIIVKYVDIYGHEVKRNDYLYEIKKCVMQKSTNITS